MKTKQNFNVLDCTLRDGDYYNKWNFSNNFIRNYLTTQNKISSDIIDNLQKLGHETSINKTMGSTQSIQIVEGIRYGYADLRRPNSAVAKQIN